MVAGHILPASSLRLFPPFFLVDEGVGDLLHPEGGRHQHDSGPSAHLHRVRQYTSVGGHGWGHAASASSVFMQVKRPGGMTVDYWTPLTTSPNDRVASVTRIGSSGSARRREGGREPARASSTVQADLSCPPMPSHARTAYALSQTHPSGTRSPHPTRCSAAGRSP